MSVSAPVALLVPDRSPVPSSATFGHPAISIHSSTSSDKGKSPVNGHASSVESIRPALRHRPPAPKLPAPVQEGDEAAWGSNFWVTLVDPQVRDLSSMSDTLAYSTIVSKTQTSFFACPATGQVSWDPPVGNFVYVLLPYFICPERYVS
jgi:Rho GTPase-activating protein 39